MCGNCPSNFLFSRRIHTRTGMTTKRRVSRVGRPSLSVAPIFSGSDAAAAAASSSPYSWRYATPAFLDTRATQFPKIIPGPWALSMRSICINGRGNQKARGEYMVHEHDRNRNPESSAADKPRERTSSFERGGKCVTAKTNFARINGRIFQLASARGRDV